MGKNKILMLEKIKFTIVIIFGFLKLFYKEFYAKTEQYFCVCAPFGTTEMHLYYFMENFKQ